MSDVVQGNASANASEVRPGARLWLSQRALQQISLDVFPVLLARILDTDFKPRSGSFMGFDWSMSNLHLTEVQLRPPYLKFIGSTGLFMACQGGFKIAGSYSITGRSWYSFLRSEGSFSVPVGPGSLVGGFVFPGVSGVGKPTVTLSPPMLRLIVGRLEADGYFSRSLLSSAAWDSIEAEIAGHLERAVLDFGNRDITQALAELDLRMPVKLLPHHDVISYDFSVLQFTVADGFLMVDLRGRPMDRLRPARTYSEEPTEMQLVPPADFTSSMATLMVSSWASDGALWLLNRTGPPPRTAARRQLPALLADEIAQRLSSSGSGRGGPFALDASASGAFGLALFGREDSQFQAQPRARLNADAGTATASADFRWDLAPFLAAKYGRPAATQFTQLALEFATSVEVS